MKGTDLLTNDCEETRSNGYVFVSHNHKDIKIVRSIRNQLEQGGFEPILFYLKCMDTENADTQLLKQLIHHEIEVRKWFLYIDSINARQSKWVQDELEYIRSNSGDHVIKSIDINNMNESEIRSEIAKMMQAIRFFLVYSMPEYELVRSFADDLSANDLQISSLIGGSIYSWKAEARRKMRFAAENGGIIFFASEHSLRSINIRYMISYAKKIGAHIIPILLDETKETIERLRDMLGNVSWLSCSRKKEDVRKCVETIVHDITEKFL